VQPQLTLTDFVSADGLSQYTADPAVPIMGHPLPSVFEEDWLSSVPSYVPLNPSSPTCSFLGPAMSTYMLAGTMNTALSADCSGIFDGGILTGSEWQPLELDYRGENGGIYCPDSLQHVFNPGDLQVLAIHQIHAELYYYHYYLLSSNLKNLYYSIESKFQVRSEIFLS